MTSENSVTHKKNNKQELNRFFNSCSALLQQSKKIGSITSEQLEQTVTESFGLLDSNSLLFTNLPLKSYKDILTS